MTEERPAYGAGVTVGEMLDLAASERTLLHAEQLRTLEAEVELEKRRRDLLGEYGTSGLRQGLLELAGELTERRLEVAGLIRTLKEHQEHLRESEIVFRIAWREGPQAQEPDPTTGKVNQAWVTLREDLAMYGAAHLREGRFNVSEAETALRMAQAELEGAMDRFAALRYVARLTSAELIYLGEGG